jgi:cytoskeletal protein RodZ
MLQQQNGFSRRRLEGSITLGERLTQLRSEAGLSADKVSQHLGIARQYVESIESGEYDKLPGEVYIRNFLCRYAKLLNVQEASVLKLFDQEFLLSNTIRPSSKSKSLPPQAINRQRVLTPIGIKRIGLGLLVLAILVYLGWEVSKIVSPPNLERKSSGHYWSDSAGGNNTH